MAGNLKPKDPPGTGGGGRDIAIAPAAFGPTARCTSGLALEPHKGASAAIPAGWTCPPRPRPALVPPLLTDLQVNGGGGVMVTRDPTPDVARRARPLRGGTGASCRGDTGTRPSEWSAAGAASRCAGPPASLARISRGRISPRPGRRNHRPTISARGSRTVHVLFDGCVPKGFR